jgi:hypothetical protein
VCRQIILEMKGAAAIEKRLRNTVLGQKSCIFRKVQITLFMDLLQVPETTKRALTCSGQKNGMI